MFPDVPFIKEPCPPDSTVMPPSNLLLGETLPKSFYVSGHDQGQWNSGHFPHLERKILREVVTALQDNLIVTVSGFWCHGKTSLGYQVIDILKNQDCLVNKVNFISGFRPYSIMEILSDFFDYFAQETLKFKSPEEIVKHGLLKHNATSCIMIVDEVVLESPELRQNVIELMSLSESMGGALKLLFLCQGTGENFINSQIMFKENPHFYLTPFTHSEFTQIATWFRADNGVTVSDQTIEKLYNWSGGHPLLSERILIETLFRARRQGELLVDNLINTIIDDHEFYLETKTALDGASVSNLNQQIGWIARMFGLQLSGPYGEVETFYPTLMLPKETIAIANGLDDLLVPSEMRAHLFRLKSLGVIECVDSLNGTKVKFAGLLHEKIFRKYLLSRGDAI